jgi:periplasmic divalent cation tolerance protein
VSAVKTARVALVTAPDAQVAERIARTLVEERLAACVNILPGARSVYRWQGKVEDAQELVLVVKTVQERVPALVARIPELHPHKVPEVIVLAVESGLPAYLSWVVDETAKVIT